MDRVQLPKHLLAPLALICALGAPALAQDEVKVRFSVEPSQAAPGDEVELRADVVIAPKHYVYAKGEQTGVKLSATLPPGLSALGEFQEPKPKLKDIPYMGPNGTTATMGTHVGELRFVQRVKVTSAANGTLQVPLEFAYQVCNDTVCLLSLIHI